MTHIQQRRGPALEWAAQNPVLFDGEAGHEDDTGKWKLGDGATAWNALPYKAGVDSVAGKTGIVALGVGDVSGAAPLVDPAFTGSPTAPTPAPGSDSTRVATTEWVRDFAAPAATSAPIQSPAFTGNPTAPTPTTEDNDTSVATTGFVKNQGYAPLASPVLTGDPKAPTPAATDNDTTIATTAFVKTALAAPKPGEIIAATIITAAGNANTTAPSVYQDLPPYVVTFTAPPSGRVKVLMTGLVSVAGGVGYWGLRESGETVGRVWVDRFNSGTVYHDIHIEVSFYVSGLVPGSQHTYQGAHLVESSATGNNMYATWGGFGSGQAGACLFEVTAMP